MDTTHQQVWDNAVRLHSARTSTLGNVSTEEYDTITERDWNVFKQHISDRSLVLEYGAGDGRIINLSRTDCGTVIAYEPTDSLRSMLTNLVWDHNNVLVVGKEILEVTGLGLSAIYSCNVVPHLCDEDLKELMIFAGNNLAQRGVLVIDFVEESDKDIMRVGPNVENGVLPIYKHGQTRVSILARIKGLVTTSVSRHEFKQRTINVFKLLPGRRI